MNINPIALNKKFPQSQMQNSRASSEESQKSPFCPSAQDEDYYENELFKDHFEDDFLEMDHFVDTSRESFAMLDLDMEGGDYFLSKASSYINGNEPEGCNQAAISRSNSTPTLPNMKWSASSRVRIQSLVFGEETTCQFSSSSSSCRFLSSPCLAPIGTPRGGNLPSKHVSSFEKTRSLSSNDGFLHLSRTSMPSYDHVIRRSGSSELFAAPSSLASLPTKDSFSQVAAPSTTSQQNDLNRELCDLHFNHVNQVHDESDSSSGEFNIADLPAEKILESLAPASVLSRSQRNSKCDLQSLSRQREASIDVHSISQARSRDASTADSDASFRNLNGCDFGFLNGTQRLHQNVPQFVPNMSGASTPYMMPQNPGYYLPPYMLSSMMPYANQYPFGFPYAIPGMPFPPHPLLYPQYPYPVAPGLMPYLTGQIPFVASNQMGNNGNEVASQTNAGPSDSKSLHRGASSGNLEEDKRIAEYLGKVKDFQAPFQPKGTDHLQPHFQAPNIVQRVGPTCSGQWTPVNVPPAKPLRQFENFDHNSFAGGPSVVLASSLSDLKGNIHRLSQDQVGCRLLQQKLEESNPAIVRVIFEESKECLSKMLTDPFGNYLFQKIMEKANNSERTEALQLIQHNMADACMNLHGTRSIQKIIELCKLPHQVEILKGGLEQKVIELCMDQNGNHVIQKLLQSTWPAGAFIVDAILESFLQVAMSKHGCCVLQRSLDCADWKRRQALISSVTSHALVLVQDRFGNYVVQYVLDLCNNGSATGESVAVVQNALRLICNSLLGNIAHLSTQKFSSNVVERCLEKGPEDLKLLFIEELCSAPNIADLLRDQFGNYVIQRALSVSSLDQGMHLVKIIRPHLHYMQHSSGGRRILAKVLKRFPTVDLGDELLAAVSRGTTHLDHKLSDKLSGLSSTNYAAQPV